MPLLLGFYHLLPPAKVSRRDKLEWAVIEEPEMGLHPHAITAVLTVVWELVARGYRVCISTHSSHVLDLMWALRFLQGNDGGVQDVLRLLGLGNAAAAKKLATAALDADLRVYYFSRGNAVRDISHLDPGADDHNEREWGGLTSFSGMAGDVVAAVADRSAFKVTVNRFRRLTAANGPIPPFVWVASGPIRAHQLATGQAGLATRNAST